MTVYQRVVRGLLGAACALGAWSLSQAHHSFAMFDMSKQLTVVGTVRELEWVSPHIWLWIDVPKGQGASDVYGFEGLGAGEMHRREGWSKSLFKPADKVTVQYAPFRSGKNGGRLVHVVLADGHSLNAGAGDGGPPGGAPPPSP